MQDRWQYMGPAAGDRRGKKVWSLQDSYPRRKVIQRGAFFDAQRENVILGRFATLEEAQRRVEADAERVRTKRPRMIGLGRGEV